MFFVIKNFLIHFAPGLNFSAYYRHRPFSCSNLFVLIENKKYRSQCYDVTTDVGRKTIHVTGYPNCLKSMDQKKKNLNSLPHNPKNKNQKLANDYFW